MTPDTRPTSAQFKAMSRPAKKDLITPTHNGEPITAEMQAQFKADRLARRAKVANGSGVANKSKRFSGTGRKV